MKLATSRFANQKIVKESGMQAVGITLGQPKFRLQYRKVDLEMLAPRRDDLGKPDWDRRYRKHLESLGVNKVDRVLHDISEAYDGADLVLLCFECLEVDGHDSCHRRIFAEWWEKHTNEVVPELKDEGTKKRQKAKVEEPSLFDVDWLEGYEFEPKSSAIAEVKWAQEMMMVQFTSGHRYVYKDVPLEIVAGWMSSKSAGKYFHRVVKPKEYEFERLEVK